MKMHLTPIAWIFLSFAVTPSMAQQPAQPAVQQQPTQTNFTSTKGFVLEDETPVRLRLNRTISSADEHVGDTVDFEVLDDLTVNGVLVIPKGGMAFATVTEAQAKRRMARGGKLDINVDYVKLVSGERAALRAVRDVKGGGHTGGMVGGMVATSLVFFPAAPFFLFMHGKDISIPKGTEITAYVNGDMKLDIAKFGPAVASEGTSTQTASVDQSPPTSAVAGATAPGEAMAEISSDPLGADIEIDGNFVGSTPSSLGIVAGEHTLRVSKQGYKRWERSLRTSTGNIKVAAVLEPMPRDSVGTPQAATEIRHDANPSPENQPSHSSPSSQEPNDDRRPARDPASPADSSAGPPEAVIGVWFTGNPTVRHDGVEISGVQPKGPADNIGIKPGDVILAIDGHYLFTIEEVRAELLRHEPGARVTIRYRHYQLISESYLTLGARGPVPRK
ncbi:MAG TPA: PEGA domain-containing protein [Candidatus Sulfotelmatobacter sp.]|nr:PEGA domain-containing protein [Candidatus Sulfotelmatobacter sp.]